MQIQVNSDRTIVTDAAFLAKTEETLNKTFQAHAERISRIVAYFSDENGPEKSSGVDKRCLLEVRVKGRQPMVVVSYNATPERALADSCKKMRTMLLRVLNRMKRAPLDPTVS